MTNVRALVTVDRVGNDGWGIWPYRACVDRSNHTLAGDVCVRLFLYERPYTKKQKIGSTRTITEIRVYSPPCLYFYF